MPANLTDLLSLDLPAFVIGIGIHEFMHAFAADRLGDPTPRQQGRVSLNPIDHLDPIGTVLPLYLSLTGFPLAFGWGKPVQFDPQNFRNPERGYGIVAFAGPLGNLLVCVLMALGLGIAWSNDALRGGATTPTGNYFYRLCFRIFAMNLGLFLFNLVPIPPLDGSKVLMWLGGKPVREKYEILAPYSILLLFGFLMLKLDRHLLAPVYLQLTALMTGELAAYVIWPAKFVADFL